MPSTAKTIVLKGDRKSPEPAEHHIIFPGGSVSVHRTTKNKYWVHIVCNDGQELDDTFHSKKGEIEDIRDGAKNQFSVLIGTT